MKKKRLLMVLVPIYIVFIIVLFIFLTIRDSKKEDEIDNEYFNNSSIYLKGAVYDYIDHGNSTLLFINVDTIFYNKKNLNYYIGVYDTVQNKATVLTGFYHPNLIDGKKIQKDSLPDIEINSKKGKIIYSSLNYNDTIDIRIPIISSHRIKNLKCYNCITF